MKDIFLKQTVFININKKRKKTELNSNINEISSKYVLLKICVK